MKNIALQHLGMRQALCTRPVVNEQLLVFPGHVWLMKAMGLKESHAV